MSAVCIHVPKYCLHKARGLAYVRDRGKVCYLGKYGSPESKEAYGRFLIKWEARRAGAPLPLPKSSAELTVVELCAAYLDYAEGYYRKHGQLTRSLDNIKRAIKVARDLYGHQLAATFGPLGLLNIQHNLAARGATRAYVNKQVGNIKRMFQWGVSRELIPPSVQTALSTVEGLRMGRSAARESRAVAPVADEVVDATLPHLPPVVADMVRFERLTGCRPGEVCMIRPCDVDRSNAVWRYRPESHKTEYHGRERIIYIGPQAQEVLLPYLLRDAEMYCFQPAESERKRREEMRSRRRTPVQPSQWNRRKNRPIRPVKATYDHNSYAQAIRRAVEKANAKRRNEAAQAGDDSAVLLPHWHPNQLRHTMATEVRRRFGLEASQVSLGHAKADVTQVYAERDARLAVEVALKIG
ncbi:MAG: site-specific integrase [Thermoguttaceae bacterium]